MKFYICLYQEFSGELQGCLEKAKKHDYNSVAIPIVNPNYYRDFQNDPMKTKHLVFSRSDLIIRSAGWLDAVIAVLSDTFDCDAKDEQVRIHSEKILCQELSFATHLVQHGSVMINIKSPNTVNLARIISKNIRGAILAHVPISDPGISATVWRRDLSEDQTEALASDTWNWWNRFRTFADFNAKLKLALELTEDVPSQSALQRWLGEPIECIVISSHLFVKNNSNYPVLPKTHQEIVSKFIGNNVNFIIKANMEDPNCKRYREYIKYLIDKHKHVDPLEGFDDVLEIPLQPLFDNLDTYTYEIFEKDPIKYKYYQNAIEAALVDKVPENEIANRKVIIMVVGAGRGPLVRAALNASVKTKRTIKIYIIEKNPNAIVTLNALVQEMWSDKDIQIISCDMRDFTPPEKADILVSELLGSFGDNELSPECLEGAQKHLKKDGISIPSKSTSYLNPLMSSKIYNLVRQVIIDHTSNPREKMRSYATQAESTYVVYLKNVYHIAAPQPVFTFVHPNRSETIDNTRFTTLRFNVTQNSVLHGFAGYFDTVLYKDIVLSIHPQTHSYGLSSWFSTFFPITEPQQLKAGDTLEVNFWRGSSSHKVWYEWSTSAPVISHIHNQNGRSCPIYK